MKKIISMIISILITFNLAFDLSNIFVNSADAIYWPVPGHTNTSQGWHNGNAIDISDGSIAGADVIAACGGTVCNIYLCSEQHLNYGDCNGFGTGVVINGTDGRVYQYAHMQANSIPSNVYNGAYVNAGQKIGKVGTTGYSTGNHLHFGISIGKYWYESGINPLNENYIYESAHTHSYSSAVTKQATCTEQGLRTYTCSCGNSYTEAIAAIGHSYKNTIIAPTSDNHGYTLHECSKCGYSYKDAYTSPIEDDSWIYTSKLPDNVTDDKYEIQYQNIYQKNSPSSPGNEWKKGDLVSSGYENVGSPYESNIELETSDTRTLLGYFYYHYCSGAKGNEANYESNSTFPHYDYISSEGVYEEKTGLDSADNRYRYYYLKWNNGSYAYCNSDISCGGVAGTHGNRSYVWYKCCTYQDRKKVDTYNWTKESDWETKSDSTAYKTVYRYKKMLGKYGDINKDGSITISDAVLLKKYLIKIYKFNSDEFENADMNNDGKINVFDFIMLKRQINS